MGNYKIERDIGDGWYFFIDIVVRVPDSNLSISCQLEKIRKLKYIIYVF